MKRSTFALAVAALLLVAGEPLTAQQAPAERYDIIISGGRIVDGTGMPWYHGDVGIAGGTIRRIGDLSRAEAARRIDASGMVVAPGFIDPHTHAIGNLFEIPTAEGYLLQGMTTAIDANDGGGPFPLTPFTDSVTALKISPNLGLFVGHNTIRREVMGMAQREPTAAELERMKEMVAQGMRQGALGLSTGLAYTPGNYSKTEEIVELAKVAASYGGIYISHMRDEGGGVLESVRETIRIGEEARIPVQMTHHKVGGRKQFGQSVQSIAMMEEARARGVDVTFDQYPYTASSTGVGLMIPRWAMADDRLDSYLSSPADRTRIKEGMLAFIDERFGGDPSKVQVVNCRWDPSLAGKTLADILREQGRPVTASEMAELVIEMEQKGGCGSIFHAYDEADVVRFMQSPYGMIGSDGSLSRPGGDGSPHPRAYGTYPRVLGRYVRDQKVITLEEAIRKMTSFPAARLGLQDRGLLREGMAADVVVFDPDRIIDHATFTDPHQYSTGVEHVVVNGVLVIVQGKHTGARPGRVLPGPAMR